MSRIPPLRRISAEDFKEQAAWIDRLIVPLNDFFERTTSALNRSLTINDNFAGEIRTVDIDGQFPLKLVWSLAARPTVVFVGNAYRSDGTAITTSPQVRWSFNQSGQLQIDSMPGLLPGLVRFTNADVSAANDTIAIPSHGLATSDKVVISTTGTVPTGLTAGSAYFAIVTDTNTVKLATTAAGAVAGTAVNITATSGSGQHLLSPAYQYRYKVALVCLTG